MIWILKNAVGQSKIKTVILLSHSHLKDLFIEIFYVIILLDVNHSCQNKTSNMNKGLCLWKWEAWEGD